MNAVELIICLIALGIIIGLIILYCKIAPTKEIKEVPKMDKKIDDEIKNSKITFRIISKSDHNYIRSFCHDMLVFADSAQNCKHVITLNGFLYNNLEIGDVITQDFTKIDQFLCNTSLYEILYKIYKRDINIKFTGYDSYSEMREDTPVIRAIT